MPVTDIRSMASKRDLLVATASASHAQLPRLLGPLLAHAYRAARSGGDFILERSEQDQSALELLVPVAAVLEAGAGEIQCLIISRESERIRAVVELAEQAAAHDSLNNTWRDFTVVGLNGATATRDESEQLASNPDIVAASPERLIDFVRRDSIDLTRLQLVVIDEPDIPNAEGFNADIQFIYSKITSAPRTCVFTPAFHPQLSGLERILSRPRRIPLSHWRPEPTAGTAVAHESERTNLLPQECTVMSRHGSIDESEIKTRIDEILRQILEEEDPDELNAYKKLVKKHVPVFRRAYFVAYLLKYAGGEQPKGRKSESNGDYTSVFVGVGKNRKVYPRDLIQLFSAVDGVSSEDIGQIKILDNYSFLEITPEKAKFAIDTLNGREFRGRRLSVNFARKKD